MAGHFCKTPFDVNCHVFSSFRLQTFFEKRKIEMEGRYKKLELVFNKPTAASKKKKKEPEPEPDTEQEEEIEEEEEEDDDAAPEEEAIGADDEDDDEAVVEEEYISDVE